MSEAIPLSRIRNSSPQYQFLTERRSPSPHDADEIFNLESTSHDDPLLLHIHPLWKRDLHALLEQPTSSPSAFLIHILMTSLIVCSAVVTVLETVPAFHYISVRLWFGVETSLVALFTVEYVARAIAWSGTGWMGLLKWIFSFFGIIDLLAILPYYIEIMLHQDTSVLFRFSILRMFRLLRVFRPFRYNHTILLTIEVMYLSVRRSQAALLAIGFFVVMILTVFSTLLYFAERGTWDETLETFINSDGDPTQFASIPAAAWFVLVTITTVGYGEITPRSFLGRLVTLPLLVFGLLLIALPSFVLGREFSLVWERMSPNYTISRDEPTSPTTSRQNRPPSLLPVDEPSSPPPSRDLTNRKLAENQTELYKEIVELRAVVDSQGEMMKRLLSVMEQTNINGNGPEKGSNI